MISSVKDLLPYAHIKTLFMRRLLTRSLCL